MAELLDPGSEESQDGANPSSSLNNTGGFLVDSLRLNQHSFGEGNDPSKFLSLSPLLMSIITFYSLAAGPE